MRSSNSVLQWSREVESRQLLTMGVLYVSIQSVEIYSAEPASLGFFVTGVRQHKEHVILVMYLFRLLLTALTQIVVFTHPETAQTRKCVTKPSSRRQV